MATFVLVAGAWHGGWCWARVSPLLRRAGHEVYAPTLTGLGERRHLASRETDFETHVQDVVNVLIYEDLSEVILVGHSYGGVVTGAVAHRVPERINRLVFLDALLPEDGRSVLGTYEDYGVLGHIERWTKIVDEDGDGWLLPSPPPDSPNLRITNQRDIEWIGNRLCPQPFRTMTTAVRLGNAATATIPRTFVSCLPHPPSGLIPIFAKKVAEDPDWHYREMWSSHDPMITDPDEFARLLIDIVSE